MLNPIENVWSMMASDVYNGDTQYSTIDELKEVLKQLVEINLADPQKSKHYCSHDMVNICINKNEN